MYPNVVQLETRREELLRELRLVRELRAAERARTATPVGVAAKPPRRRFARLLRAAV